MRNTASARRGLRWTFTTVLKDLDDVDDPSLKLAQRSPREVHPPLSGLKILCINNTKTNVLRTNPRVA